MSVPTLPACDFFRQLSTIDAGSYGERIKGYLIELFVGGVNGEGWTPVRRTTLASGTSARERLLESKVRT